MLMIIRMNDTIIIITTELWDMNETIVSEMTIRLTNRIGKSCKDKMGQFVTICTYLSK